MGELEACRFGLACTLSEILEALQIATLLVSDWYALGPKGRTD